MHRALKQRQEALYQQLPHNLHLDNSQVSVTMDMPTRFAKSLARLDHLQNLFFISRLLVKATSSPGAPVISQETEAHLRELVQVSFNMLVVILGFWTHGTHGPSALQINYDWLIVAYACPAAGVLCGELLQPQIPEDGMAGLRRSDIVHQLSLLSGFLTWIGPEAANSSLWIAVKDVIHRVLDQLLNAPTRMTQTREYAGRSDDIGVAGLMSDVDLPEDFHELFGMELLDSFEWLRPE